MKRITKKSKCTYEDCKRKADHLVFNRDTRKVQTYCEPHAKVVIEYQSPEYEEWCPNCGCGIPIN